MHTMQAGSFPEPEAVSVSCSGGWQWAKMHKFTFAPDPRLRHRHSGGVQSRRHKFAHRHHRHQICMTQPNRIANRIVPSSRHRHHQHRRCIQLPARELSPADVYWDPPPPPSSDYLRLSKISIVNSGYPLQLEDGVSVFARCCSQHTEVAKPSEGPPFRLISTPRVDL
ncbi:glycosyl transferase family 1 [Anopheles sinensis]|uniref:Glycosyl transferase family 1 n=1 Tax=Anopheles sinensis TaxID=74873 RepID=A0A084WFN0_ANOSI|nr:glycosyl transferase family 1 [Anopheles sinensis]